MNLQAGQNVPLEPEMLASFPLAVRWSATPAGYGVDVSCFALDASGKVRGDEDFVFFNAASLAGGGLTLDVAGNRFDVALERLPAHVEKLAFALTITEGQARGHSIAGLGAITVDVQGAQPLEFSFETAGRSEVAITLCEVYRRAGGWRLRALAQGFNGGLAPLAESYGVDIDSDEGAATGSAEPTAPPPQAAPSTLNLSKITLDKRGESISLEKRGGASFGEIVLNLNWTAGEPKRRGLFGRSSAGIDLDLGCLFELDDGRKGAVQALGNVFGAYDSAPWIKLDGDDRSGSSTAGETIRVNGERWESIARVLVYAYIYEGAPNWQAANGVVTLRVPGQADIEVRMDSTGSREGMCAIALLENFAGAIRATKVVDYFRDHKSMDRKFGWGLNWVAGSKD